MSTPDRRESDVSRSSPGGASQPGERAPRRPRAVWVIDADDWPRAYLVGELAELGFEVRGFPDPSGALIALARLSIPPPVLVVVDLAGSSIDPIDLTAFFERTIPVIAIADALAARDEGLGALPWASLVRRPCTIGEVVERVRSCLGASGAERAE